MFYVHLASDMYYAHMYLIHLKRTAVGGPIIGVIAWNMPALVPSILGYSLPVASFRNATRGKNACWLSMAAIG